MKPTLTLTFDTGYIEKYTMCIDIDEHTARRFTRIKPLDNYLPGSISMETAVDILKTRVFRKDFFVHECYRLGNLLAERMEDAEGWHDTSRIELAKKELAG